MKAYTDLEQSKKLSNILPLESADMGYGYTAPYEYSDRKFDGGWDEVPYPKEFLIKNSNFSPEDYDGELPCWSLGALLEFLPKIVNNETLFIETSATLWHVGYRNVHTAIETHLIDACYELIIKLKELYNYDTRRKA